MMNGVEPTFTPPDFDAIAEPMRLARALDEDGRVMRDEHGEEIMEPERIYPRSNLGRVLHLEDVKQMKRTQGAYPKEKQQFVQCLWTLK